MKARFLVCTLLVLSLTCVSSAQLSGNYTIDPSGSGPTNYTTWAAAISALGAGVSGPVVFDVASATFNESVTINPISGTSASATVTFQAKGAPAVLDAGSASDGLALNTTCSYLIFDNIVVNLGNGSAMIYGFNGTVLDYNDLDYNCYYAPNNTSGTVRDERNTFTGTPAAWKTYFAGNPSLIPAGGGTSWDQNSIEADPGLVSMAAPYDIHLKAGSTCLDAGTTTYIAGTWISYNPSYVVLDDFEGDARPATNVDIGADEVAVRIVGSGSGKPGTTITLNLFAPADVGLPYQIGSSLGNGPIPIDTRLLYLTPDSLLVASVNGYLPTVFVNYTGFLDTSGQATAGIVIPNIPALTGIRIYSAFVTIKAGAPSNLQSISGSFLFTIM